jgi:DNA polymerase III subunit gamma/tau
VSLISQRPDQWKSIVGQDRAITVLQSALTTSRFLPKGLIFKGARGVGKTTTAYITAKALMCVGKDPLGCGKCNSCIAITQHGLNLHPDFLEIDAASKAGVQDARELLGTTEEGLPQLGKRRVTLIDEAHRLSREAWDAFLKPLESDSTQSVFIFSSNEADKIPLTISSRCGIVSFSPVDTEVIRGLLVNVATANQIVFESDAMKIIAQSAKGHIREAIGTLGSLAAMGNVTKNLALAMVEDPLRTLCIKILTLVADKNQIEAVKIADSACNNATPTKVIETLFSEYAKAIYTTDDPVSQHIALRLSNLSEVRNIFISWLTPSTLPSDTIPLVVYELINTMESPASRGKAKAAKVSSTGDTFSNDDELLTFLGGKVID